MMDDTASPGAIPRYVDFSIEVGPGTARSFPVTVRSIAGEADVTMVFPYDEAALETRLLELENALLRSGGTRRIAPTRRQRAVQEFGQALFEALLADDARRLYYESQGDAAQRGQRLRIKLSFDSPELAALPWEFLFDPRQADFVSLSANTPIVRYIGLPQPIEPLRVTPPLLVLGMVAVPGGLAQLDIAREQQQIGQALQPLTDAGLLHLTWLAGQTWRDLQREIRQNAFNVFHFIGHGQFDPDRDEGLIVLSEENGAPYHLRATELAMLLADEPSLRLVVLNACEGAQGSNRDIFASTASILVRRGVPAVLAMQYAVTDKAAISFSRAFYEAVADGEPMEAAVAEGRKAVRLAIPGTLEWATPVLYQRAPDGILFEPGARATNRNQANGADAGVAIPLFAATYVGAQVPATASLPTSPPVSPVQAPSPSGGISPFLIGKVISGLVVAVVVLFLLMRVVNQPPAPAPVAASGSILDARISEPEVTLGAFCAARPETAGCDGLTSEQSDLMGNVVAVTVEAQGYAGKTLPLTWTIYDASTQRPLEYIDPVSGDNTMRNQPGWPADGYVPDSNRDSDRNELDLWVPSPIEPGRYYMSVELFPDVGARLDSFTTAPFTVT